jgi:hypothetical protein
LLYAPLVSDRELRIVAERVCWRRKGSRKEGKDVDEDCDLGCTLSSDILGGILAQLMFEG